MKLADLNYPPELPVTEHREEILAALRRSPVVIVCGDTGSGKTTQLPKMALELRDEGRGMRDEGRGMRDEGRGMREEGRGMREERGSHRRIACTQPRRLAAVTMAERVASELKSEVGALVGYRHRFARQISAATRIEFMTDGVLLAETRFDPLLRAYDTIIVDEAHERSLNVDFLLGILKRILERRSDLKVIVSSATLDVEHFSAFFDNAPIVRVPGRLYPIEIGYRPPPEDEERDLPRDVAAAVAELPPRDDILVFLPGERDIRETADYLSDVRGSADDVIPLLASLPAAEQRRAFRPSSKRRIILATNVAETSVTIPGIRAVIDSGLARISRYVHRTQVQRLQIEPISQASARQRSGRCGRLGPGICLRLYSEEDFASREPFTPPEVLRSSLAGVILTMLDLGLGDIERFPFLDPPKPAMIREGLLELLELGAIERGMRDEGRGMRDEGRGKRIVLTKIGRQLAKIPVEPRLARMLLAASRNAVLPSVLPIVAAMACEDPRRRPIDEKEKSDQAHARFRVTGSDFLGTLSLWEWWCHETDGLSQSKARKLCKTTYLSYPKMREWRDLVRQLDTLCKRLGLDTAQNNGDADLIHRSLLTGLLGRIGKYDEENHEYRGAHGLRFALHPSSVLAKALKRDKRKEALQKSTHRKNENFPSWLVAGELVDTARLFARNAAVIDVRWLESIAGDICRHSYHSPAWDPLTGFVRATEQVTLYGLVIVPARRCDFSRIDLKLAREIFIRRGLVDGEFPHPPPAVRENLALLAALRTQAERARHPEFFDADRLFAHFDKILPPDVASADALRKWLRRERPEALAPFVLKKSDWWPDEARANRDFPNTLRIAGVTLALSYRNDPDHPDEDGITCSVRQSEAAVLRLWRSDWLVPGLLPEKLTWMLSTLPTALRRLLSPIDESVAILLDLLKPEGQSLEDAVRSAIEKRWAYRVPADAWSRVQLPAHLQMRLRIRDDTTGRTLAVSRDLEAVLAAAGVSGSKSSIADVRQKTDKATAWIFGTIPERATDQNAGWTTEHYPALVDLGDGVTLRLFTNARTAAVAHAAGVTRLFCLALAKTSVIPFRRARQPFDAALYLKDVDYDDKRIAEDLFAGAVAETFVRNRPPVRSAEEFARRLAEDRSVLIKTQTEFTSILIESAALATKISSLLDDARLSEQTTDALSSQLAWLLYRGFPRVVPLTTLRHYKRYLKGALIRVERARLNARGDLSKELRFAPYWERYREAAKCANAAGYDVVRLADYRWMLEEYRISLFAQELHTPESVSPKRLDALWSLVKS